MSGELPPCPKCNERMFDRGDNLAECLNCLKCYTYYTDAENKRGKRR